MNEQQEAYPIGFVDPAIDRKASIINGSLTIVADGIPLPSVVEVSESGTCNRVCSFCPRSDPDYHNIKKFIEPALIEKLTWQLKGVGFKGIFLLSGFVEPLLDKNIFHLLEIISRNLPNARVEMVTNGDVLNSERLVRLFECGLSTLLISVYDGEDEALGFETMCRSANLREDQYVIRHRYLPVEQDFGITLSNRAGLMDKAKYSIPIPTQPLDVPCYYPHYTFFLDYLGDVLLCPHDWGKKLIVGNLNNQDFMEIWTGPKLTAARRSLADGNRGFSPCNICDVKGVLMGRDHVKAWNRFANSKKSQP